MTPAKVEQAPMIVSQRKRYGCFAKKRATGFTSVCIHRRRLTIKLSDPAHERARWQPGRDGRVRCSALVRPRRSHTQKSLPNWWHKKGGKQIGIFLPTSFCLICRSNFPKSVAPKTRSAKPLAVQSRLQNPNDAKWSNDPSSATPARETRGLQPERDGRFAGAPG